MEIKNTSCADYPHDLLIPDDIEITREILRGERETTGRHRQVKVVLNGPLRNAIRAFEADNEGIEQKTFVILRGHNEKTTYKAAVSLDNSRVISYEEQASSPRSRLRSSTSTRKRSRNPLIDI